MRAKSTQNLKRAFVCIGAPLVFAFILFQLTGFVAFSLVWAGVFAYAVTTIASTVFMYWVGKTFGVKQRLSMRSLLFSISIGGLIVMTYALFAAVHTKEDSWLFMLPALCIMISGALIGAYATQKSGGSHGA